MMKKLQAQIHKVELVFPSPLSPQVRLWIKADDGTMVKFDIRHMDYEFVRMGDENGGREAADRTDEKPN